MLHLPIAIARKFNRYLSNERNFRNYIYRATPKKRTILVIKVQNLIKVII